MYFTITETIFKTYYCETDRTTNIGEDVEQLELLGDSGGASPQENC